MNDTKLQLEAGKYYRMRDGRKAYIDAKLGRNPMPGTEAVYAYVGFIEGEGFGSWTLQGDFFSTEEHEADLVAEWVEPKRIKGWVNIYPDVNGNMPSKVIVNNCLHETKDDADTHAMPMRLACIEIDVLEGAGLDGEVAR